MVCGLPVYVLQNEMIDLMHKEVAQKTMGFFGGKIGSSLVSSIRGEKFGDYYTS